MSKQFLTATIVLVGVLSSGCQSFFAPATGESLGNATLQVQPQLLPGGLMTQAVVNNYTSTDVNHLQIKLFKLNGSSENPVLDGSGNQLFKDIVNADLSKAVTFSNLNANTTYRIRAYAFADAGTASLISTSDVNSYTDVTLTSDDRPTLTTLRVKLIDRVFNGQATASGVVVTNGGLVTTGNEAIN